MNASELLEKGHMMVVQAVDGLPELQWDAPGVCGEWSVKDIIAHLASYEHVILDVLNTFSGKEPTPYVLRFIFQTQEFDDAEVAARKYATAQQVIDEYQDTQVQTTSLLEQIPLERVQQPGTMPWYQQDLSLADFINRMYEHTREHCDQIMHFHDKVKPHG
jgi:uncharacterized damage-inducible protein DinB